MIYLLYLRPGSSSLSEEEGKFDQLAAIPEALAKWAIIVPPVWLAWHRLWWSLLVYLVIAAIVLVFLSTPFALAALYLGGIPGLYLLLEGNNLRGKRLERMGYDLVDVVDAPDEQAAVERFLERRPEEEPSRTVPQMPALSSDRPGADNLAFGMFPESS